MVSLSVFRFSYKSEALLTKCEYRLRAVVYKALQYSIYDFGVTETLRSEARQLELFKAKKSTTMKSRHLANDKGLSEAIDIAVYDEFGAVTWDEKYYRKVAQAFFRAAIEEGVQIEWGGLWMNFLDCCHFQLLRDNNGIR